MIDKIKKSLVNAVKPEDKIIVAVSGGIDSCVLLHSMVRLSKELGCKISAAHFNHQARAEESYLDQEFVSSLAVEYGLEFFLGNGDVFSESKINKITFQDAARRMRRDFLCKTLEKTRSDFIALGHNSDDQAETLLINLLRGSGLKGLGGMFEARDSIIRPLLNCSRMEIEDYAEKSNVSFREDSSNKKKDYLRNRIRHDLLPVLESYNPRIKKSLAQTAKILRDEEVLLSLQDKGHLKNIIIKRKPELQINLQLYRELPAIFHNRLSWSLLRIVYGGESRFSYRHVSALKRIILKKAPGGPVSLPQGWRFISRGDIGLFKKGAYSRDKGNELNKQNKDKEILVKVPGRTIWQEAQIQLNASLGDKCEEAPGNDSHQAFLDFDLTGEVINGRFILPGDRFIPLGMTGRKKLKDFFIDNKIDRESRKTVPVLTNIKGDIIWVVGMRISNLYRITDRTKRILHLTYKGL